MGEYKKAKINNKLFDVVSYDTYEKSDVSVAIQHNSYLYPERSKTDTRPGLYENEAFYYLKHPETEEEIKEYSSDNIIDFKSNDIREMIEKSNKLRELERQILTTPNNTTRLPIQPNDKAEMVLLKSAINCKNTDINNYADVFGDNFQNDKRILNTDSCSMPKLKNFAECLGLKLTLSVEDISNDTPNPMGKVLKIDLVKGGLHESTPDDI